MELLAYFLADFGWQKEERGDSDGNTGPCRNNIWCLCYVLTFPGVNNFQWSSGDVPFVLRSTEQVCTSPNQKQVFSLVSIAIPFQVLHVRMMGQFFRHEIHHMVAVLLISSPSTYYVLHHYLILRLNVYCYSWQEMLKLGIKVTRLSKNMMFTVQNRVLRRPIKIKCFLLVSISIPFQVLQVRMMGQFFGHEIHHITVCHLCLLDCILLVVFMHALFQYIKRILDMVVIISFHQSLISCQYSFGCTDHG